MDRPFASVYAGIEWLLKKKRQIPYFESFGALRRLAKLKNLFTLPFSSNFAKFFYFHVDFE